MHVVVTGANGFVGRALCRRLCAAGELHGRRITRLSALDLAFGEAPVAESLLRRRAGDLADRDWVDAALEGVAVEAWFHLASVPGGSAEADPVRARRVNLDTTVGLLEHAHAQVAAGGPVPVFVFASSIAVFGAMPGVVTDETPARPAMTYGAHKLVGEILVDDFSRRGAVNGRSLRIPGVLARPPARTGQLSAFLSDIIRELLAGRPFTCPMAPEATTWASSLHNVVDNLTHAAAPTLAGQAQRRCFTLPTLRFSMRELVAAIGQVRGQDVGALVRYAPDPRIQTLFGSFGELRADAAQRAGFAADADLATLVRRSVEAG